MSDALQPMGRWLAIAEEEFVPADSGGRVESLNMLRAAQRAGIVLRVVVPGMVDRTSIDAHRSALPSAEITGIPRATSWRSNLSLEPYIFRSRPMPASLPALLAAEHKARPFDAVLAVSFRVVHLTTPISEDLGLPQIVRPHNIESEYFAQLAASTTFPRDLMYRVEGLRLRGAERRAHASSSIAVFADIGERDAAWRAERSMVPVIHIPPFVPEIIDTTQSPRPDNERPIVLFLGALDNANNVDGIRWFAQYCWPGIRERVRHAELHVVGRRAPQSLVDELVAGGARVTPDAPQIAPLLAEAQVFVNPVRQGSGVNIKMIDAMSAGLAVVSTSVGARGVHWVDGDHLLVADDPGSFSAAVIELLDDHARRDRLGAAAAEFVRAELDGVTQIRRMAGAVRPRGPQSGSAPSVRAQTARRTGP